jgi:hypothetical protein
VDVNVRVQPARARRRPNVAACLITNGDVADLIVSPGLDFALAASVTEWAEQRLDRFEEAGPEPDGWQRRKDGTWQLWPVNHPELSALDFD